MNREATVSLLCHLAGQTEQISVGSFLDEEVPGVAMAGDLRGADTGRQAQVPAPVVRGRGAAHLQGVRSCATSPLPAAFGLSLRQQGAESAIPPTQEESVPRFLKRATLFRGLGSPAVYRPGQLVHFALESVDSPAECVGVVTSLISQVAMDLFEAALEARYRFLHPLDTECQDSPSPSSHVWPLRYSPYPHRVMRQLSADRLTRPHRPRDSVRGQSRTTGDRRERRGGMPEHEGQVLGIVACAAEGVQGLRGGLVAPALARGWRPAIVLTPTAWRWLEDMGEVEPLEKLTGLPVRAESRLPSEARPHPYADAFVVAPATAHFVAKLATGMADNQALTQVSEAIGMPDVPVVVWPSVNAAHTRHPAWEGHIAALRHGGVRLIYGPEVWPLGEPRQAVEGREPPWEAILQTLEG